MNSTSPKIAAVVVTYNRKDDVIKTLHSILGQDPGLDIIVVDNNSSDGTEHIVKDINPNRIHYLRQRENLGSAGGFAAGMQFGVAHGYDFVWLFNDDSRPAANAFNTLRTAVEDLQDKNLGLIKIGLLKNGKSITSYWRGRRINKLIPVGNVPVRTDLITFDGCLISTQLIKTIGTCDPVFFMGIYEFDFCLRARDAGYLIYTLPNGLIEDEKKGSAKGVPFWRMYYVTRNHLYLGLKRRSAITLVAFSILELKKISNIIFLQKDKAKKLRYKFLAIYHAFAGKMGRRVEPTK